MKSKEKISKNNNKKECQLILTFQTRNSSHQTRRIIYGKNAKPSPLTNQTLNDEIR